MPDSGSHRHPTPRPPHHRPPPLLVIAAAGLAVVLALGITLVILRALGDHGKSDTSVVVSPLETEPPRAPPPSAAAPASSPAPARAEVPAHAAAPTAVEPPPDEVPEWERKPLRTAQPFPEEARIDPPMPPIKIPPEMLVPIAAPDAARAL